MEQDNQRGGQRRAVGSLRERGNRRQRRGFSKTLPKSESDSGFRPFGSTGDAPGGGKKSREVYRRRSEARHRFGIELVSSPASSVAARRGTAVFVGGDGQIQMVAGKAPVRRSRKKIYSLALRQRAHRSGIIQYRTGEG